MKKNCLKFWSILLTLALCCFAVAGCGGTTQTHEEPAVEANADSSANESSQQNESGGYKIAFSNSYIGNAWRAHSVTAFEEYAEHLKEEGMISEFYVSSSGNEPQAQINEIRNMMSKGYDAIIVNAASPTALVPVLEEAVERGITVVSVDNVVQSDLVYNMTVSNYDYGYNQMQWVADQTGGQGDIIIIRGIEGTPVSNDRTLGYEDVLAKYPNLNVVGDMWGAWDHATVASQIGNVLDANMDKNIVAIISEAAGEQATIEAMMERGMDVENIAFAGATVNGFFRISKEMELNVYGYGYPPYMTARGLELAVQLLEGQDMSYEGDFIPIQPDIVTQENIDDFIIPNEPDEAFVDIVDLKPYAY